MSLKKSISLTTFAIIALSSASLYAAEENDPSDVARASTSFTLGATNKGDVKGFLTYGFGVNDTQQGMIAAEVNLDNETKYRDARLQYFHVFNFESSTVPKIAASIDIIDNASMTTGALGAVVAITPADYFSMYLRAGVLAGQYSDTMTNQFGVNDDSAFGGMVAGYFTFKTGADGTFIMLNPEYTYVSGDIDTSSFKSAVRLGSPLNAAKTQWGEFRIEHTGGSVKSASLRQDIDDTVAWFMYKSFF